MENKNLLLAFAGSLLLAGSLIPVLIVALASHGHFGFPPKKQEGITMWCFSLLIFFSGIYLFTKIKYKK